MKLTAHMLLAQVLHDVDNIFTVFTLSQYSPSALDDL